ncbi:unnamed protein product [Paramecium sonneborni]|uniref:Uncharacterized protein n=1 Tax=Paramecium sonneborni TaxID=65129 RepID=A0A8S1MRG8_9CILI|nr:unnamed protein product [Paramecium sonneborni]
MKEPFVVQLKIKNINIDDEMKLPLKKDRQYYTITKKRLIIFLKNKGINYNLNDTDIGIYIINIIIIEFFIEFYDQKKKEFQDESQIFDFDKNEFFFHEKFFEFIEIDKKKKKILHARFVVEANSWIGKKYIQQLKILEKQISSQVDEKQKELQKDLEPQYQEIENIKQQLEKLCQQDKYKENEEVDLVILYSCPLLLQDDINKTWKAAKFIEYESEINEILEQENLPKFKILLATDDNLIEALNYNPQIIHLIINGDIDLNKDEYYLEFQEEGSGYVKKKYLYEFRSKLIEKINQGKLKKLKLISISSIIAKEFIQVIKDNWFYDLFSVIGQIKVFNSHDKYGDLFWKHFYEQLFSGGQKQIEEEYKKVKDEIKIDNSEKYVVICCCFHEHSQVCKKAPQKIGYSESHEKHLQCSKQKTNNKGQDPQGYIFHNNEKCNEKKNEEGICINYQARIDNIFKEYEQEKDVEKKKNFQMNEVECCCCCYEYDVLLSENKVEQKGHLISQKFMGDQFGKIDCNLSKKNEIDNQSDQSKIQIPYLKINKQIIIIFSSDSKDTDNKTKDELFKYFEIYNKKRQVIEGGERKKVIAYVQQNHKENNNIIYEPYTFDVMMKVDQFFEHKEQDKLFTIITIQDIDDKCLNPNFKQFNEELHEKFKMKENIVIIFTIQMKNRENIVIPYYQDFYQLIYPQKQ